MHFSVNAEHSFEFKYLLLWGGQYLPAIRQHQSWRWLTAGKTSILKIMSSQRQCSDVPPCRVKVKLASHIIKMLTSMLAQLF